MVEMPLKFGSAEALIRMTEATAGEESLAAKTSQIQIAQADLATADLQMQTLSC